MIQRVKNVVTNVGVVVFSSTITSLLFPARRFFTEVLIPVGWAIIEMAP